MMSVKERTYFDMPGQLWEYEFALQSTSPLRNRKTGTKLFVVPFCKNNKKELKLE